MRNRKPGHYDGHPPQPAPANDNPLTQPSKPLKIALNTRQQALIGMLTASLMISGCAMQPNSLMPASLLPTENATGAIETGSIAAAAPADAATQTSSAAVGTAEAVLKEASRLRALKRNEEALTLLSDAAQKFPENHALKVSQGLLALETGKLSKAKKHLKAAVDTGPADWRALSGLGSVYAAEGKQTEAQQAFAKALRLNPDHPSILNNLALSYALDGKRKRAEAILRRVTADDTATPQATQNLALLLGLEGRKDEASRIAKAVLPEPKADANIGYLEELRATVRTSRADPKPESRHAKAETDNQSQN